MNGKKIFVIGSDLNGKLGLGQIKECHTFTEITELSDKLIEEIFESNDCMFARSETNDIYSWANNYWGQLGRGFESSM
jgi:alpha-tubulin suppressor-like RCC1 family protein